MKHSEKIRRAIEHDLARSMAAGWDTDERLALAEQRIEEAERLYRQLAEVKLR
jgi:hypothetical protein